MTQPPTVSRYRETTIITLNDNPHFGFRPLRNIDQRVEDIYHEILYGDTLQRIAWQVLGDARYWWVVADFNDIIDPFEDLLPGTQLRLPSISRLYMEVLA